jgi:transcriptional regulator with XRE-family HTH domain
MLNRAAPNYKNFHPLVITLRLSLHPDRTLGERLRKWRLERGLYQVDLAKMVGVNEMTIVNWEKGRTKPTKKNLERINAILVDLKLWVKNLPRYSEFM